MPIEMRLTSYIGRTPLATSGLALGVHSPIDGQFLGSISTASTEHVAKVIAAAHKAFLKWRTVPGPRRGELVRRFGQKLREHKAELAKVVTLETGKITQEALGEVQEMIDICDFAVGLSRQLHGLTIASERPGHRMMEQWHPLGAIGVITAFNFPVAVWAWNAALALVCGDTLVWKPSEKTPLSALAAHWLLQETLEEFPEFPDALASIVIGARDVGEALAAAPQLPLISATGSVRMGQAVAKTVASRLGRSLLELGGNNGMIVTGSADLELATRAIVFAAVGTAGQRCTSLRRLIVHKSIEGHLVERLKAIYSRLPIGDPRETGTLVGPLIDFAAYEGMQRALRLSREQGGQVLCGGERISPPLQRLAADLGTLNRGTSAPASPSTAARESYFVRPALVAISPDAPIVTEETFAPILYILSYKTLEEAIHIHNGVPQGLSSAIFTSDVRDTELFLSAVGSDCGIANVNIGTSGAEIGGAFGGEKATGGGRESGSDAWKNYMRRATNTINYSTELPLAQGIEFDVAP